MTVGELGSEVKATEAPTSMNISSKTITAGANGDAKPSPSASAIAMVVTSASFAPMQKATARRSCEPILVSAVVRGWRFAVGRIACRHQPAHARAS